MRTFLRRKQMDVTTGNASLAGNDRDRGAVDRTCIHLMGRLGGRYYCPEMNNNHSCDRVPARLGPAYALRVTSLGAAGTAAFHPSFARG